jgi:hypothetical protein
MGHGLSYFCNCRNRARWLQYSAHSRWKSLSAGSLQAPNELQTKSMADTACLIRITRAALPPELVTAERIEFQGEHLVFLRSDGSLAALFVLEIVESWSEVKS